MEIRVVIVVLIVVVIVDGRIRGSREGGFA
jgi:hypothetical protein